VGRARLFVAPVALPPALAAGAEIALDAEGHRHLARVLRLRVGDEVTLFDGAGHEIEARVVTTDAHGTRLALGARRAVVLPGRPVVLLQALPKADRMDLVVQKTTELGVSRIQPVLTERTVAEGRGEARLGRWRTIAQEAARQCGRADLPTLDEPRPLAEVLAQRWAGTRLVAWEEDRALPLSHAIAGDAEAATLLIGPEGGFTAAEVAAARAAGFQVVGLGPLVLRSETAAIVAVALCRAALGGLG
jgi:16S rRNA (uracil1498-N3)-methyltransferase